VLVWCAFTSCNLFCFLFSHREEGGSRFLRNIVTKHVHYTVYQPNTSIISEISPNGLIFPVFYSSFTACNAINYRKRVPLTSSEKRRGNCWGRSDSKGNFLSLAQKIKIAQTVQVGTARSKQRNKPGVEILTLVSDSGQNPVGQNTSQHLHCINVFRSHFELVYSNRVVVLDKGNPCPLTLPHQDKDWFIQRRSVWKQSQLGIPGTRLLRRDSTQFYRSRMAIILYRCLRWRKMFCKMVRVRTGQGAQPAFYPTGNVAFLSEVRRPKRVAHSPPSTVILNTHELYLPHLFSHGLRFEEQLLVLLTVRNSL
jgi:hypothetical protein